MTVSGCEQIQAAQPNRSPSHLSWYRRPYTGEYTREQARHRQNFLYPNTRTNTKLNSLDHAGRPTWDNFEPQFETPEEDEDSQWEEEEAQRIFFDRKFRLTSGRKYRVARKPKNVRQRFEEHRAEVERVAEVAGLENVWEITYTPARFEGGFLKHSLEPFYGQDQIVDVMAQVKGGKEASVYRCRAHPSMGVEWIAAKVYRPRQFRNLRNDAIYREGRQLLSSEEGRPQVGAVQNGGEFLAISGKLHWIPKPATLVAPKSGPHPPRLSIPVITALRKPSARIASSAYRCGIHPG